ncbi:MAG TPA: M23 family metallopeptidase [Thermodesulfobacteriota bacterium]|nr:M23 family metallopeptidase [Thermodesulfobacteriota bacterium]
MKKIRTLLKKGFTPITIMVVPHDNLRSLNIRIPVLGILFTLILSAIGGFYIFSLAANGMEYQSLIAQVDFYQKQFSQWNSTVFALKEVEEDFRKIFSVKSKEKVLQTMDTSYSGSVDLQHLTAELQKSVETVDAIKDYLRIQKDIYLATPKGYPVNGSITSPFGARENPFSKMPSFHSGIDISASPGTSIQATADGVVSYSGWTQNSGYVVAIEHGLGFSTIYAHNKKNIVSVGQKVKRGEVIGYVGSTGKSTGPHVHYEVWEKGKHVNPQKFLRGIS